MLVIQYFRVQGPLNIFIGLIKAYDLGLQFENIGSLGEVVPFAGKLRWALLWWLLIRSIFSVVELWLCLLVGKEILLLSPKEILLGHWFFYFVVIQERSSLNIFKFFAVNQWVLFLGCVYWFIDLIKDISKIFGSPSVQRPPLDIFYNDCVLWFLSL